MTTGVEILAVTKADLEAIATIHRAAQRGSMLWLPDIHTPEDNRWFFENIVFMEDALLVTREGTSLLGFVAFWADWLYHLYVHPVFWRKGVGARLLTTAKASSPALQLWAVQKNHAARRVYAAYGFVKCEKTDG